MAIRITCPSCSAALSVKDELAGRAVKCPKCGGVIQVPKAAATPPLPPAPAAASKPAPESAPFEEVDEPAKPPKSGSKPSIPAVGSKDADEEGEDRPRRRGRDDRDRDDRERDDRDDRDERRERSKKRDRDDDRDRDRDRDDDRPAKRRRRDDRDDDDRPRGEKKGSNGLMIGLIILAVLLVCCVGPGISVWYAVNRTVEEVKKGAEEFGEKMKTFNPSVTKATYDTLTVGATTRQDAEFSLSGGKVATNEDLDLAFATDAAGRAKWAPFVASGRAIMWRNDNDFLFAVFHPDAKAESRLQLKEWRPKVGLTASGGETDDEEFVKKYPPDTNPQQPGGALTVTTEQLAKEFDDDNNAANKKYKGKTLIVSGPLTQRKKNGRALIVGFDKEVSGTIKIGSENGVTTALRGQTIRFKGKCQDGSGGAVNLIDCEVLEVVPAQFTVISADKLFAEFAKDSETAQTKYVGGSLENFKYLHVTNAVVTDIKGNMISLGAPTAKGGSLKLQAAYTTDDAKQFSKLKVGDKISVKGQCSLFGEDVVIDWATVAP